MTYSPFKLPGSLQESLPLGLHDIEQLRLILQGHSALDWRCLSIESKEEMSRILWLAGVDIRRESDQAYLNYIYQQALTYLDTYIQQFVDDQVRFLKNPEELLLLASRALSFNPSNHLKDWKSTQPGECDDQWEA